MVHYLPWYHSLTKTSSWKFQVFGEGNCGQKRNPAEKHFLYTSERYKSCTVLFSDVVGFTDIASNCSAEEIINMLNDMYYRFDSYIECHGVYKVFSISLEQPTLPFYAPTPQLVTSNSNKEPHTSWLPWVIRRLLWMTRVRPSVDKKLTVQVI